MNNLLSFIRRMMLIAVEEHYFLINLTFISVVHMVIRQMKLIHKTICMIYRAAAY